MNNFTSSYMTLSFAYAFIVASLFFFLRIKQALVQKKISADIVDSKMKEMPRFFIILLFLFNFNSYWEGAEKWKHSYWFEKLAMVVGPIGLLRQLDYYDSPLISKIALFSCSLFLLIFLVLLYNRYYLKVMEGVSDT